MLIYQHAIILDHVFILYSQHTLLTCARLCQPFGSISVRVCVYGHVLMCILVRACARYCSLHVEVKGPDLRQGSLSVAGYSRPTGLWTSGESPRSLFCLTIGACR